MTDFHAEQTVRCDLCAETITGRPQDMRGNHSYKGARAWYSSGNNGRVFALCPGHATTENIRAQFARLGVGQ